MQANFPASRVTLALRTGPHNPSVRGRLTTSMLPGGWRRARGHGEAAVAAADNSMAARIACATRVALPMAFGHDSPFAARRHH
jgi:hypothetical protein